MVEHEDLGPPVRAALMAGDHPALGEGGDGPAAEAHLHRAARVGRGHRVARAAHRDARLAVGLRAQRDRGLEGLGGERPAQHARNGRAQIVVANAPRHPAEAPEGERVALEERLLALAREAHVNRPPRVREPQHEHRQHGLDARQPHADPAEVHLRLLARGMQLGDRHDLAAGLELAPQAGDAGADRRLGDRRAILIDEALPDGNDNSIWPHLDVDVQRLRPLNGSAKMSVWLVADGR